MHVFRETDRLLLRRFTSRQVMQKVGLTHVRTFHEEWEDPIDGAEHGEFEYALTRGEWLEQERTRR